MAIKEVDSLFFALDPEYYDILMKLVTVDFIDCLFLFSWFISWSNMELFVIITYWI